MKDFPPAYQSTAGSALDVDKAFYIGGSRKRRRAAGWSSPSSYRSAPAGPGKCRQATSFASSRSRARRSAISICGTSTIRVSGCGRRRTRQLQAAHVTVFDRLWSTLPYLRPMVTITSDSLAGYGVDDGGRIHDLLGTRCDPYVNRMLTGDDFDYCCHSNLVRAVAPHGLTELDVHDVLNVFHCTGLNRQDKYFMRDCPARTGDHLEFFAEIDLLCALSTCPGGDLSVPLWGPDARDPLEVCRPLGIEVYALDEARSRISSRHRSPPTRARTACACRKRPGKDEVLIR